jgi:hypothetical protein
VSLFIPLDLLPGLYVEEGDLSRLVAGDDGFGEGRKGGDGSFGANGVELDEGVDGFWSWEL